MEVANKITYELNALHDETQAAHLSKFFKTGKGEYGEGDRFLGIRVPVTRSIVKKYRTDVTLADIDALISSEWHEIRLAGFLLLVELYSKSIKRKKDEEARAYLDFYLSNISKGNNWDLVDLVADKILGDWVVKHQEDESLIMNLSNKNDSLWHQRVAVVSTLALIRAGRFNLTFTLAEKFLNHPHDLIQKATGWMLRETGKRGGRQELINFLNHHKRRMARTTLRYAIERFTETERKHFMTK